MKISILESYKTEVPVAIKAYCNYDCTVKQQKDDWSYCQNSYECQSNLCSGQECTGINAMIRETTRFKALGVRIYCKLASWFGLKEYDSCIVNYLGQDYLETASGGGGGSGSYQKE